MSVENLALVSRPSATTLKVPFAIVVVATASSATFVAIILTQVTARGDLASKVIVPAQVPRI